MSTARWKLSTRPATVTAGPRGRPAGIPVPEWDKSGPCCRVPSAQAPRLLTEQTASEGLRPGLPASAEGLNWPRATPNKTPCPGSKALASLFTSEPLLRRDAHFTAYGGCSGPTRRLSQVALTRTHQRKLRNTDPALLAPPTMSAQTTCPPRLTKAVHALTRRGFGNCLR